TFRPVAMRAYACASPRSVHRFSQPPNAYLAIKSTPVPAESGNRIHGRDSYGMRLRSVVSDDAFATRPLSKLQYNPRRPGVRLAYASTSNTSANAVAIVERSRVARGTSAPLPRDVQPSC